jgi:tRNA (cmo5U34)-methyltransferase
LLGCLNHFALNAMMDTNQPFSDRTLVAEYVETTPRKVPGLADLHRMAMLLMAERLPEGARILVLGAGGGLELKAFAEAQAHWTFEGVDPSVEMLDLARSVVGPLQSRIEFRNGYIDSASSNPFDGATCLLTMHFLDRDERLRTLKEIHRRLKPGAPLIVAHHSRPDSGELSAWLVRSAVFAGGPELDFDKAARSAAVMTERLHLLHSNEEEALLSEAGFSDIALFYAGFSFRGWVAFPN